MRIYSLLFVFICFVSCNGQVKTNAPIDVPRLISAGQPKLIKSKSSDPNQQVQCGLQDKAGNLWFGTTADGVYRYDGKLFTNFTVKDGLNSNNVWCMLEDKAGNLWFGTGDGICRYEGKKFISVPINATNRSNFYSNDSLTHNSWPKNTIFCIIQDRTGMLWFGTGDGVYCYDGTSFTYFLNNPGVINKKGLYLKGAERILEDKQGNIWFGGRSWDEECVCRYNPSTGELTNFKPDNEAWLRPVLLDRAGNVWFSSRGNRMYRYNEAQSPVARLNNELSRFTRFAEKDIKNWVFNMAEDKAGNLWMSSGLKGGVTRYDGKSFKNFTTEDGLSNNSIGCIVEDRDGHIWFGTKNTGLCRYDGMTFTNFAE